MSIEHCTIYIDIETKYYCNKISHTIQIEVDPLFLQYSFFGHVQFWVGA
jgi:hypothetical protein